MTLARRRRRHSRVGRPRGPAPDPRARRDELLDAAVRAIRATGPGASMTDIASEAGLSKPILYAHFGDKEGLAAAVAERYLGELLPAVLAAFQTQAAPREMVRAAIDTFIGFVERDPDVYRFLVRGVGSTDRSFVEQRLIAEFGLRIAQVLRTALRDSGADSGPAELWSFSILGTVLAGAEWWQSRPSMSRADLVDHLTAFVYGGLTAGGLTALDAAQTFDVAAGKAGT